MNHKVLVGNFLEVSPSIPSRSIHCAVTSPPYFGLRSYSVEPVVWGGESHTHEWDEVFTPNPNSGGGATKKQKTNKGSYSADIYQEDIPGEEVKAKKGKRGVTSWDCKCGAWKGNLGSEKLHDCGAWARQETPCNICYVCHIRTIAKEIYRALRDDGTFWLNISDSASASGGAGGQHNKGGIREGQPKYSGRKTSTIPEKNILMIPALVALALQSDGWYLRSDCIWNKKVFMPDGVKDRPTRSHEYIYLFSKKPSYYYDRHAIREPAPSQTESEENYGRNRRTVIEFDIRKITPLPKGDQHFAVFPESIPELAIRAGTSEVGCCADCGAQWERVTKKVEPDEEWKKLSGSDKNGEYHGIARKDYSKKEAAGVQNPSDVKGRILEGQKKIITVGWKPTCKCNRPIEENIRSVVLDPFSGMASTGCAALRLGRDYLGVELSPTYASLSLQRLATAQEMGPG